MADEPKIDDRERKEGERTEAPKGEGHRDTEPEEEVIPHSAKAMSDYHDGLKDLTAAAEHHHGEFLKEMKKHHGAMEHMTVRKHFGNWLQDHEEALGKMLECHKGLIEDMGRKFKRFHPDLEPLEHEDEEENLPERSKPTSEPRESRSEREDVGSHRDEKSQPITAPATPVTAPAAPVAAAAPVVETKSAPSDPEDLSEEDLLLALGVIGQLKNESKQLRQDFAKAVG